LNKPLDRSKNQQLQEEHYECTSRADKDAESNKQSRRGEFLNLLLNHLTYREWAKWYYQSLMIQFSSLQFFKRIQVFSLTRNNN